MKNIIQGTLRLFVALVIVLLLGINITNGNTKTDTSNVPMAIGYYLSWVLFLLCFLYMLLNALREFKEQRIKYKGMYWVSAFIFIICNVVWIPVMMRTENFLDFKIIIGTVFILCSLYFIIADFIALYIKRKKNIEEAPFLAPSDHLIS